jgi:glycosyltransferase involved in cell wall biosynthesis
MDFAFSKGARYRGIMGRTPLVSVVVPVYNARAYLGPAIESLRSQTWKELEIVAVDDGSTDESLDILHAIGARDRRLRVVPSSHAGISATTNLGLALARGDFIATMDCDDVSLPRRIEKQVTYMQANPTIDLCGTAMRGLGSADPVTWTKPRDSKVLKGLVLFEVPVINSTAMFRRQSTIFDELRYDGRFDSAQDYDLWERIAPKATMGNLSEVLVLRRAHSQQCSSVEREKQRRLEREIWSRILARLGLSPREADLDTHRRVAYVTPSDICELRMARSWLDRLDESNRNARIFGEAHFRRILDHRWYRLCLRSKSSLLRSMMEFVRGSRRSSSVESVVGSARICAVRALPNRFLRQVVSAVRR